MNASNRTRLVDNLRRSPIEHVVAMHWIEKGNHGFLARQHWLWDIFILLTSNIKSTEGLAKLKAFGKKPVLFRSLHKKSADEVESIVTAIYSSAKLKGAAMGSNALAQNFKIIEAYGGIQELQKYILSVKEVEEKVRFIALFKGVQESHSYSWLSGIFGPKHPEMFILDNNLMDYAMALELDGAFTKPGLNYFFTDLALDANQIPWKANLLISHQKDYYLSGLLPHDFEKEDDNDEDDF